jgi:hypothetical protein
VLHDPVQNRLPDQCFGVLCQEQIRIAEPRSAHRWIFRCAHDNVIDILAPGKRVRVEARLPLRILRRPHSKWGRQFFLDDRQTSP